MQLTSHTNNSDNSADNCEPAKRARKPYRTVRVFDPHAPHGIDPRLILEIYPNGTICIREHGRRVRRETHAAKVYFRCIMAEIASLPRKRRRK